MYSETGQQLEGDLSDIETGKWIAWFSYQIDGKIHEVQINNHPVRIPKTLITLDGTEADILFTLERRKDFLNNSSKASNYRIWIFLEYVALLIGTKYAFYNACPTSIIVEDGKHLLWYSFDEPFYLVNQPIWFSDGIRKIHL